MTGICDECGEMISVGLSQPCPHCGVADPLGRRRRLRQPQPSTFERFGKRWGTFTLLLGSGSACVLIVALVARSPAPAPRYSPPTDVRVPPPSVPLAAYESIREFDDVTLVGAEGYRQMIRAYAQACGTTEQDVFDAVQPAIDLYREEEIRPRGRIAQYIGIAAQRLGERGDTPCGAFLGATLMAGVLEAQTGR